MTQHVVIADAGPLIALARLNALGLLHELFGHVCITRMIHNEVLPEGAAYPEVDALTQALSAGWIEIIEHAMPISQPLNPGVDAGEASAIDAANHLNQQGLRVLLVMDDRAGRLEAKRHGLVMIGTAGVIGLAKTRGLVPAARPLLEQLVRSGYFISTAVLSAVLSELGEA